MALEIHFMPEDKNLVGQRRLWLDKTKMGGTMSGAARRDENPWDNVGCRADGLYPASRLPFSHFCEWYFARVRNTVCQIPIAFA